MPGRRLNRTEQKLFDRWAVAGNNDGPVLRSIEISGGTGLRGINGLIVHFRYPITAICGTNGVGKSTVLALSALAFRSPEGWHVHRGHDQPQPHNARSQYLFSDFFVRADGEAPIDGVSITWRYRRNGLESSRTVTKSAQRWGRLAGRLERATHFVPLGRLTPAYEVGAMRSVFTVANAANAQTLGEQSRLDLSYIMGREYGSAGVQRERRWLLQRCATTATYSAFNMGGGESCVISLLHLLETLPNGGMLVIEEIEAGLHPQAQIRLAERLVDVALRRGIQIICTTHSPVLLDALPRQSRLLLQRQGDDHIAMESPATRFAMAEMTGQLHPELVIYCEDRMAAMLIEEALPPGLKPRVAIIDVGSKVTVIRQGVAHRRGGMDGACICVLDGDVKTSEIADWLISERGGDAQLDPPWLVLPGAGDNPERWLIKQLGHADYEAQFARRLGYSIQEARALANTVAVELDSHDLGRAIHQRTGLDAGDGLRRAIQACAAQHPQLDELRAKVGALLA